MDKQLEARIWTPNEVDFAHPIDGVEELPGPRSLNWSGIEVATPEELDEEIRYFGRLREPEMAREIDGPPVPPGAAAFGMGYAQDYPTHFDFRPDVADLVSRVQRKFPWRTFANSYYMHPPVYGRTYEFVSVDFWQGGRNKRGRYVGYRGKPLRKWLGWQVFNAIFNDPFKPNIYWIIWQGRMWTRGYGWGPAPYGPADSDAGHYFHIHVTYQL